MSKPPAIKTLIKVVGATKLFWGIILVLVIGALVAPIAADGTNIFLSAANLTDVLRQVSITGIIAVGMTLVILTGGIDLSVGSVMAMGSTLTAMLLTRPAWHSAVLAGAPAALFVAGVIIAAMLVGLVIGCISGVIIAKGGLQPFIATLAMMVTVLGVARLTAGEDQSVYPVYTGTNAPAAFEVLRLSIFGVPIPGLIFLAIVLLFSLLLMRFRFGREIYAIGGNEKAAYLAGVNVARVKILVYALSGMLASFAGVLYVAQYRQGKPDAGTGLELDAIAAVVIGGASLMGGKGTIYGTLAGVLIFGLLSNIFQLCNIDSNMQLVLKGIIIVVAVLLQEGAAFKLSQLWRRTS